jgi:hypothetical protein
LPLQFPAIVFHNVFVNEICQKRPSSDVAKEAGVSTMTVSRVINGRGEISRRSSPWRFPPWKRRDDTYFICAENLAVDRPKPERLREDMA